MDDILPELPGSTLFILLDAKSGYWHVILNREIQLAMASGGYIFQETLYRVVRGIQNVQNIADEAEVPGDKCIIT